MEGVTLSVFWKNRNMWREEANLTAEQYPDVRHRHIRLIPCVLTICRFPKGTRQDIHSQYPINPFSYLELDQS